MLLSFVLVTLVHKPEAAPVEQGEVALEQPQLDSNSSRAR
jgi:hypothetical protein